MLKERFSRHFFVVHTFVSEEARREYLTPPEKREPPEPRPTELQWAVQAVGEYAQCMQTWVGNDDFYIAIGSRRVRKMFTSNSMLLN